MSGTLVPSGSPVVSLQFELCCLIVMSCFNFEINKFKLNLNKEKFKLVIIEKIGKKPDNNFH